VAAGGEEIEEILADLVAAFHVWASMWTAGAHALPARRVCRVPRSGSNTARAGRSHERAGACVD
jgi:hypothetical protein